MENMPVVLKNRQTKKGQNPVMKKNRKLQQEKKKSAKAAFKKNTVFLQKHICLLD